jgi:hypothetical protein
MARLSAVNRIPQVPTKDPRYEQVKIDAFKTGGDASTSTRGGGKESSYSSASTGSTVIDFGLSYERPSPRRQELVPEKKIPAFKTGGDATANKKEKRSPPKRGREPSYASGSTGTTLIGFTPPHEKSYPRKNKPKSASTLSSDATCLTFTPHHELSLKPAKTPVTKKSLPWIRRPTGSPQAPSPNDIVFKNDVLEGWVSHLPEPARKAPESPASGSYIPESIENLANEYSNAGDSSLL